MSKHDLKGMDTGKIGGNKYVDLTFEDYMKEFDLSRKGAERDLEAKNIFLTDLEPIAPKVKQPANILEKVDQLLLGYGGPTEIVGGKVVGERRPTGLGRFTAGIMPYELLGITDFDQRGNLFGKNTQSGYGGQPTNYQLPKVLKEALAKENEPKKEEKVSTDPLDQIDRIYKNQQEYERAMGGFNRKGRVLDSALDFVNLRMQMPSVIKDLKDVSTFKQQQLLDAEAIKQGLPNAVQARAVAAGADFAQQAQAVAAQQDAATRFAGLGMQRRFG